MLLSRRLVRLENRLHPFALGQTRYRAVAANALNRAYSAATYPTTHAKSSQNAYGHGLLRRRLYSTTSATTPQTSTPQVELPPTTATPKPSRIAKVVQELKESQAKAAIEQQQQQLETLAQQPNAQESQPSDVQVETAPSGPSTATAPAAAKETATPTAETTVAATTATATAKAVQKKPLMQRIKDEALHYWHGSQLLAAEIKISTRLSFKLLQGNRLTRREYRQLKRTTSDLLRLVPFMVFIIVPFMEFLLPVFLKLFPNMLPSTFESKYAEEERKKKLLKVRLEMAKFLQETVSEIAISGSSRAEAAKEFNNFFREIRSSGSLAQTDDIIRVARKFEDELTLENLSRPQLVSMCRYMNINAFGTDTFLRYQIRKKMSEIEEDDRMIAAETLDSLTLPELQNACSTRGIRTIGVSPIRLREELQQWLDLHLNHRVPASLLILARAFLLSDRVPSEADSVEALRTALSSLPDSVVNETVLHISELEGSATYKQKLDVIEQQEELIADELEQEAAEAAAKAAAEAEKRRPAVKEGQLPPEAKAYRGSEEEEEELKITEDELQKISDAISVMTQKSAVSEEKEMLESVRRERETYKEDISQLNELKKAQQEQEQQKQQQEQQRQQQEAAQPVVASEFAGTIPTPAPSVAAAAAQSPTLSEPPVSVPSTRKAPTPAPQFSTPKPQEIPIPAPPTTPETTPSTVATPSPSEVPTQTPTEIPAMTPPEVPPASTTQAAPPVDKIAKSLHRLDSRLDKIIHKIEQELEKYDEQIGSRLNLIQPAEDGKISVEQLEDALKVIRDHPEDERIKKIVKHFDVDGDGVISLDEIMALVEKKVDKQKEGMGVVIEKDQLNPASPTTTTTTPVPPANPPADTKPQNN